ncbi:MAG: class II SORL domain-containing protein [Deferribacteraceae bacterium]|jgi:superoxide reductase|nr:class II SORL domain-containing protein [Deferribacteraceae bacterium]
MSLSDYIKTADFKAEKHVPVIEAPESVADGSIANIIVSVGKEIAHPNTIEHFIGWIELYYRSDDGKFVQRIGKVEFSAHGESDLYAEPYAAFVAKIPASGTLTALSYCNLHGLWESERKITVK